MDYDDFFGFALESADSHKSAAQPVEIERICGSFPRALCQGKQGRRAVTLWSSDDTLGMGQHPVVLGAMHAALDRSGAGAGGARTGAGASHEIRLLEAELADLHKKEAALVVSTAFLANWMALTTLAGRMPDCVILSEVSNAASLVEGIRQSRARRVDWNMNNINDLRFKLEAIRSDVPKLISFSAICETTGYVAPVPQILQLAKSHGVMTYIDESRSVGLYGPHGAGIAARDGAAAQADVIQGALCRAFGVSGGYLAGSAKIIEFIRHFASGYIYPAALPPAVIAGSLASVRYLKGSSAERMAQRARSSELREQLDQLGIPCVPNDSHIVMIPVGASDTCRYISERLLREHGLCVDAVMPPPNSDDPAHLRVLPGAVHTTGAVVHLAQALERLWADCLSAIEPVAAQ